MTWPGEGLLIKLWETLAEKGIGGLLKPWQIKREALAHTQARQIELVGLADAEREADEIRSGRMKLSDSRYALTLPSPKSRETKKPKTIVEPHRAVEVATTAIVADALRREVTSQKPSHMLNPLSKTMRKSLQTAISIPTGFIDGAMLLAQCPPKNFSQFGGVCLQAS